MAIYRFPAGGPDGVVSRLSSHRPAFRDGAPLKGFAKFSTLPPYRPKRKTLEASASLLPQPLGRIGGLELRIADRPKDVKRAQRLRYKVFFEEMSAVADPVARIARRDMDRFDAVCDHLVVTDNSGVPGRSLAATLLHGLQGFKVDKSMAAEPARAKKPPVVGTYRLLRQEVADKAFGFYTAGEFAIDQLIERHRGLSFLELGRSCVLKPYRDKRTVELLWQGIWAYVMAHKVDVMIGCASLEGVDPRKMALPLSYLHHFHSAPADWAASALPGRRAEFDLLPREEIDIKKALKALPPLIKAYLRIGAYIGDGAVVDHEFGTTDVLIVMPRSAINPRYVAYYGDEPGRAAA